MKLLVAQSTIFDCLWYAQTTRALFAHAGAQKVFFCVEARTPASRERYGHLVLLSGVTVWSFQQGASHRCAGFHTLLRISRLIFSKHVFAICSDPIAVMFNLGL